MGAAAWVPACALRLAARQVCDKAMVLGRILLPAGLHSWGAVHPKSLCAHCFSLSCFQAATMRSGLLPRRMRPHGSSSERGQLMGLAAGSFGASAAMQHVEPAAAATQILLSRILFLCR